MNLITEKYLVARQGSYHFLISPLSPELDLYYLAMLLPAAGDGITPILGLGLACWAGALLFPALAHHQNCSRA